MAINPKQWDFTQALAQLLLYMVACGYHPRLSYVYRSKDEAKRLGFENSNHTRFLAADIDLFDADGNYLATTDDHRHFGEWWEQFDERARWGGRFNDGNHYSFEHNGVK